MITAITNNFLFDKAVSFNVKVRVKVIKPK
jgi:hypothetical protein